jgi:hypothetical protein
LAEQPQHVLDAQWAKGGSTSATPSSYANDTLSPSDDDDTDDDDDDDDDDDVDI